MDLGFCRLERPSRSVPRERREPQVGVASLKQFSLERANAGGDGFSVPVPNIEASVKGEGVAGLPGSKSVAHTEANTRNRGGPESSCRTNYECQAGRAAQRQGVSSDSPGVGLACSIPWQGASPDTGGRSQQVDEAHTGNPCRKNDGPKRANLPVCEESVSTWRARCGKTARRDL